MNGLKHALAERIQKLPQSPGVYIFKDKQNRTIYVGKSVRLRDRVRSYFVINSQSLGEKTRRMVSEIDQIEQIDTTSEIESLLLESNLIKKYRPKYNTQLKDDKQYKFIKICNAGFRSKHGIRKTVFEQRWPWVTTARKDDDPDALYLGPFPEGRTIGQVLKTLRRVFPYCKYKHGLSKSDRPCFYYHIKLCSGICADEISLKEYWAIIDRLILFLRGKKTQVMSIFEKKMKIAAKSRRFEDAAKYRDDIAKLEYITQQFHDASEYIDNPNLKQDLRQAELVDLYQRVVNRAGADSLIAKNWEGFRIEGYDISNLGDKFTVASRVVFIGGEADKTEYRRYRIKYEELPDDFAAMGEVIRRRFRDSESLPDLVLIDGGSGQLSTALGVLADLGKNIPMIGLAKREEILIVPDGISFREMRLTRDSPALKLIMRVRDESHRFAQRYHKLLRKKAQGF